MVRGQVHQLRALRVTHFDKYTVFRIRFECMHISQLSNETLKSNVNDVLAMYMRAHNPERPAGDSESGPATLWLVRTTTGLTSERLYCTTTMCYLQRSERTIWSSAVRITFVLEISSTSGGGTPIGMVALRRIKKDQKCSQSGVLYLRAVSMETRS